MDYNRFEADEVVSKSERELLKSCVNKRLKRLHQRELRCDDLRIDYEGMQVSVKRNGEWEDRKLAPQERKLLFFLSKRAGKVQAYDTIKVRVFDVQPDDVYGGMETTVAKLRKKIEPVDGERKYIVTVEGAGYRFDHSE
jgi:DNA-binding response OmpR family regulator